MLTRRRYFKRNKLDYPTADTTRASRRFVKNMKRLAVRVLYSASNTNEQLTTF